MLSEGEGMTVADGLPLDPINDHTDKESCRSAPHDGRLESSLAESVAQILTDDGSVAGAGFLIGEGIAVTCAHVVQAAGQAPGGNVRFVFPHLPYAPSVTGRVLAGPWRAPEAEDVAVVQLETVPAGAQVLLLGSASDCRGHRVSSFGFPLQGPQGGHFGYGRAGDLLPDDRAGTLLQLVEANDLTTGFSGAPLVDEVTGLAIGMVTSITSPDAHRRGVGIAYGTPTEVLRAFWPDLVEHQVCPYRGLEPFTADHVGWFHGRDAAVESVLAALSGRRRLLLLLGPSGAGKSSLVQAGVLPALAAGAIPGSDRWLPVLARPGRDLLAELEHAGLPGVGSHGILAATERRMAAQPHHDHLIVIIDQFEELLSSPAASPKRSGLDRCAAAMDELLAVTDSQAAITMILIMRDDFYPLLAATAPRLLEAAASGLLNVPATLNVPELQAIIAQPARAAGARFERGLPERIIADILVTGPGRQAPVTLLAPLELALSQLWERRTDGQLTHRAYQQIGEVAGSLTTWCNSAITQMPASHHSTAKRILTALVRPADPGRAIPATRQQVPVTRLRSLATGAEDTSATAEAVFDEVLTALTRHRIITTSTATPPGDAAGEPIAELIHDALPRDWNDLSEWVTQDHRFQIWFHRVTEQQIRHEESGLTGDLLDGTMLAEGIEWARQRPLPPAIATLLTTSRKHQQAAIRRTRRINTILVGILALALVAASIAFWQRHTASIAQQAALTAKRTAQSRQLAAQSNNLIDTDPDLASLLAVQAHRISPTDDAIASLYAAARMPIRHRLQGHNDMVESVAFSPDGKTLATAGKDGDVRLWNTATGAPRHIFKGHKDTVFSVAFSPDGRTLVTTSNDLTLRLWDVTTGTLRRTVNSHDAGSAVFSPDGKTIVTARGDVGVQVWDAATATPKRLIRCQGDGVTSMALSPDGKTLVTAGDDPILWDVATGAARHVLKGQDRVAVESVAFSPDGKTLASGAGKTVRLWNVRTGTLRKVLKGRNGTMSVAFSPDGKTLATAGDDALVRLWNLPDGTPHGTLKGHKGDVRSVAFSPDGKTLATGGRDHTARLWNVPDDTPRDTLKGHKGNVASVTFSPDGKTLATAADDNSVRLWDVAAGTSRRLFEGRHGFDDYVTLVVFSPDGKVLATAGDGPAVRLWNIPNGALRDTFKGDTVTVDSVAFSPDGKIIAAGSGGRTVRLWDVDTGHLRRTLKGHKGYVASVAFSPDSKTLATGSFDFTVRLWDVSTGAPRRIIKGHDNYVESVAFSPDGSILATAGDDGFVKLWNVKTGTPRRTLKSHDIYVNSAAFSPDGRILATAGNDAFVELWDVNTGTLRDTLKGRADAGAPVAFSPDGKTLAIGSGPTVRLWDVDFPDAVQSEKKICRSLHRDLSTGERSMYMPGQEAGPVCPASSMR
ncbi:nSTAND1 domain-containing NTPase [Streptomyces rubiginosohelvolus]